MSYLFFANGGGWPDPPSREAILTANSRLQGVIATTQQYGTFYAFGPEVNMLDEASDRAAYYDAQMAAGTQNCMIGWAGSTYSEPPFTFPVPGPEMRWVNDLSGFCDRLSEILTYQGPHGRFIGILLMLPGDGFTGPDNPYGYQFLMAQLPRLVAALRAYPAGDLTRYLVFCPGFDGIVWTWTAEQVIAYGQFLRSLCPEAYSALEYPAGVIGPYGEGAEQYQGPLNTFDLFLQEVAYTPWSNPDQMWQIFARMVGPKYVRPPDQPASDDPGAPFATSYLDSGTPRGAYYYGCLEGWTFGFVRGWIAVAQVVSWRDYVIAMGVPCLG